MHTPLVSRRDRAGFTFVELAVTLVILLVALLIFSSTLSSVAEQRAINRESALAQEAARNMLESLRSEPFPEVFARYNSDPADDPGGAGTAPGHRFAVANLDEAPDSPDALEGEIVFPTAVDPVAGLQLREDVVDRALGLPRDLSGDSVIDAGDHALDYFVLPVRITVRWKGRSGTREYQLTTQLCQWRKLT